MADFWDQVEKADGCWTWLGTYRDARRRYGVTSRSGRAYSAHRRAYELVKGPIPDGLQIDHLCRNTRCVNPDHLEAVTPRENTIRGTGVTARNAAATHCRRGHEFTPENTLDDKGTRACRACAALRQREWRRQNPEAAIEGDRLKYRRRTERKLAIRGEQDPDAEAEAEFLKPIKPQGLDLTDRVVREAQVYGGDDRARQVAHDKA